MKQVNTIEELQQTVEFEIFMRCMENAIYPDGFKNQSGGYYTGQSVETTKYYTEFGHNSEVILKAVIKRPDKNAISELQIGFKSHSDTKVPLYDYLLSIYNSDKYAKGKWIKACNEEFDTIQIRKYN